MSETDVIIVSFFSFTRLNIDPSLFLLQIPTFPPSPPTTPSSRMMSTSPEWFSAPVKTPYKPSPLSISIPIRPLPVMDSDSDSDINQEHGSLSSEAPTPPLSPSDTVSSIEMTGKASSYSTWSSGSDGDTEDVIVTPSCQRPSYQRRNSPSSYFNLDPCRGKKGSRSRSPGVPVSGLIEPMWKLEEKEKSEVKVKPTGTNKLLEPFQMAFPTKVSPWM